MGFKANGPVQLVLPKALNGLVVEVQCRTTGEWLAGKSIDLSWEEDDTLSQEDRSTRYRALYGDFLNDVVTWNLESADGVAVPTTMEGLESVDTTITTPMVSAWAFRNVKLPDPLDSGSASGKPSDLPPIPMAPSTPNPAS